LIAVGLINTKYVIQASHLVSTEKELTVVKKKELFCRSHPIYSKLL